MKTANKKIVNISEAEFTSVLGDEFVTATGYGVFAHLSYIDITELFFQYANDAVPVRQFARKIARNF